MNGDFFISSRSSLDNPIEPVSPSISNDPEFHKILEFLFDDAPLPSDESLSTDLFPIIDGHTFNTSMDKSIDDYQQSGTVNPVFNFPPSFQSQISSPTYFEQKPIIKTDNLAPEQIEILANPREKFRPRTEKESKDSAHYIRCNDNDQFEHPTITIRPEWFHEKSIIEVTLVDKNKIPHPYTIDNKERKTSSTVFKQEESNTLYFYVTEQDCTKGQKTFLIEYIKPKQEGQITKELIKTRELYQSMLRFTRFYQYGDNPYQRDENSTSYSSLMTEDYGDFTIEDVFPSHGPMSGNEKICIEFKGNLPKDLKTNLAIIINGIGINWSHQIENINKNRNNFTFLMPPFPYHYINRTKVNIIVRYKQDILYQSNYLYTRKLDEELVDELNKMTINPNQGTSTAPVSSTGTTNNGNRVAKRPRY